MRKLSIFMSLLLVVATACGTKSGQEESKHIYIISTNDMHAHIDAFTKLVTIVGEYEALGEVVLVDSGDRVTGNAYVDDAAQPGMPIIELMNSVGYDVVTCGNHEFDKGSAVVRQMVDGSDFEWVCANVKAPEGFDIKPYTTLTVEGVALGVVGIVATDGGGRPLGRAQSYVDFSFTTDEDAAYEACATLAPHCDFVVLLSHMGYKMDTKLAERGIACDWIAGGHSHDTANLEVGEVQLSQNRKEIRYVTIADLTVEDGQIQSVEYKQVNMADVEADAATAELVAEIKARDPELNTVEGVVNVAATQVGIANFTIDALLSYPYEGGFEPEIVFYHIGGVRLSELPAGDIKRVTILNNDPFVSTVALGTLTPDEIKRFILDKYNSGTPEKPDLESHYIYFYSNIPYDIILGDTTAEYPDAVDVRLELEPRSYRVAVCNYIAENYIAEDIVSRKFCYQPVTVREAMLRLMRSYGSKGFTPDNVLRIKEIRR